MIQCSIGAANALIALFDRIPPRFFKDPKMFLTLSFAFLRLNMYGAMERLQSMDHMKLSTPQHVKYATLLAEVVTPETVLFTASYYFLSLNLFVAGIAIRWITIIGTDSICCAVNVLLYSSKSS